jgi:Outer membrane protein beta-barrel domain
MKTYIMIGFLLLSSLHLQAEGLEGNINVFLGQKNLDDNDWSPVEDQGEFGLMFDFKEKDWPVSIAIDLLASYSEKDKLGKEVTGTTSELDIGVRKIFIPENSNMRPYIGGGLAFVSAQYETDLGSYLKSTDDDTGLGVWINVGIYWVLAERINLGMDLRYTKAELSLYGEDVEAGGTHFGLLLGYNW